MDTRTAVTLVVGQREELNLTLRIGDMHQSVEVPEYSGIVAVTTEDISGLVGERQVKDLPLNGRSYDQLLALNPGIVNYTSQRSGSIGTSNSVLGNMFAVSGRRPQENLFLLNDVEFTGASEINNTPGGASGQLLGVDAVREFAVVKDTYGAEYGKRPGAQVSIVTSSGTNQLHGSAYEFLRNSALDARNYFDQGTIPQFQRNVFGGSLGGPVVKGKTFLFGNYEGFRQHLGLSGVTLVPDNNARAGLLPCSGVTPAPNPCPASGLVNVGVAASAAPLLNLWPVANGPGLGQGIAEAFSHPLQIVNEDFGTARLDHIFRDRDSLAAVYTVDDSAANTPAANPLSSALVFLREQVVSLSETHLISSAVVNQATFGFSRGAFYFTGQTSVSLPGFVQGRPIGAVVVGGGTTLNGALSVQSSLAAEQPSMGRRRSPQREQMRAAICRRCAICSLGRTALRQPTASIQSNLACGSSGSKPMTHLHKISTGKRHFRLCRVSCRARSQTLRSPRSQPRLAGVLLKEPCLLKTLSS